MLAPSRHSSTLSTSTFSTSSISISSFSIASSSPGLHLLRSFLLRRFLQGLGLVARKIASWKSSEDRVLSSTSNSELSVPTRDTGPAGYSKITRPFSNSDADLDPLMSVTVGEDDGEGCRDPGQREPNEQFLGLYFRFGFAIDGFGTFDLDVILIVRGARQAALVR